MNYDKFKNAAAVLEKVDSEAYLKAFGRGIPEGTQHANGVPADPTAMGLEFAKEYSQDVRQLAAANQAKIISR